MYKDVIKKFQSFEHIEPINGGSSEILFSLLPRLKLQTLFWLDGHYSMDETGQGSDLTPIFKELETILGRSDKVVIVIDDVRTFLNEDLGYPSIGELVSFIRSKKPEYHLQIVDDTLRIYPYKNQYSFSHDKVVQNIIE